ncbi:MAG: TonB-dependent receptor, partial [Acidobacteriaceae bacterium]|nr:TonB-dependent receptor [Acidobacteriaceae bacterium]
LPTPTDPCGRVVYGIPSTGDEDQVIGRVDWTMTRKNSVFGRYFISDYRNPAVDSSSNALLSHTNGNLERGQSFTFGDTYSFSPTTLNIFHATFNRLRNNRVVPAGYNAVALGVNMFNYDPSGMILSVNGGFSTGASPGIFNRNSFQEADDLDLIRGKHQIALGVDIVRAQNNLRSDFNENGNFAFNGQFTGDPLADFLLGKMSDFQQSRAQVNVYRQTILGLYVQDSYKLSQRLLINAGLRWEPMLFPQDYFGRGESFSMSAFLANQHSKVYPNAPAGVFFYGDPGVKKAFTNDKYKNFSPRLGLVFNPHGDGRDTIRVGGGILYDTAEVYYAERLTTNAPYGNSLDLTNPGPLSNPWANYPGGNPFPGSYPPPPNVTFPTFASYSFIPTNLKPTYMTQWNISYQRQITSNWLASITYLGNKTSHLWLSIDLDPAVYGPGASTSNTNTRRTFYRLNPGQGQYYGPVITTDDGASATYNGVLLSAQHRFSHGFTFLANYTWSHCIDDGDFTGNVGNEQYQNQYDRRADRGDCNYDIRHIFNASFVGTSHAMGGALVSRLVRNWQLAPLVRLASGLPVTVTTGKDNSLTGINLDRPNLVPGVNPYSASIGPQLQWFNINAFSPNAPGTFGNLGRDVLRGPGQVNVDLALSRIFALTERYRLEARGEAFNAINHTNFNLPRTGTVGVTDVDAITANNFGRILSAKDPRILQFALKLYF